MSTHLSMVQEESSWVSSEELKEMEDELESSREVEQQLLTTPGGGIRMTGMMTLDELFE
jgi:hypothetical protein